MANQVILVFESGGWFGFAFCFSVDETAFEVEAVRQFLDIFKLGCILHQHHMHFFHVGSVDCENTKNFSEQRVFIILVMLLEFWQ